MVDAPKPLTDRLAENVTARRAEVEDYDISIGIHEAAIAEIDADHGGDADMADYRAKLANDLAITRRERGRAQLLLNAVQAQIDARMKGAGE